MSKSHDRVISVGSDILRGLDSPSQPYLRVLVVDDNDDDAHLLRTVLPKGEYRVEVACSATAAMPLILARNHDLYIVDIGLPDMTGIELVRVCQTKGIEGPFLIWTGHDQEYHTDGHQLLRKRQMLEPAGSFAQVVRCAVEIFRRMHSACLDARHQAHA